MRLLNLLVVLLMVGTWSIAIAKPPAPKNFTAHLSGANEAPPVESHAQGQAIFRIGKDGNSVSYKVIASNIDNVWMAHIHLAPAGSNGPVVALLFSADPGAGPSDGVLAQGSITPADLVGPLAGQDFSVLLAALRTGGIYVNVHTNDGVAPPFEGPGDIPSGELRGQLRANGPKK